VDSVFFYFFFPSSHCFSLIFTNFVTISLQTLQMGIKHFSGLFVMLCVGVALSLLTTIAEHIIYKLVIPRVKEPRYKYWLHTSQVCTHTLNTYIEITLQVIHWLHHSNQEKQSEDNLQSSNSNVTIQNIYTASKVSVSFLNVTVHFLSLLLLSLSTHSLFLSSPPTTW